jgi:prohibitin 2
MGLVGTYIGFNSGIYYVAPGQRAFKYNKITGVQETIYREGYNFKIPFIEKQIKYDIKARPQNIRCTTGSADLQMVSISLRIMFRPDDTKLFTIYRKLGEDYHARVLPSVVNEILRSVVARYTANQLAAQREQISSEIRYTLQARLRDFNIILEDTSITELEFGREYQKAVE